MIIFREHALMVKLLGDYSNVGDLLRAAPREMRHRVSRRVTELRIMGLVDVVGEVVTLTKSGKMVFDALSVLESSGFSVEELPDIWVNSSIMRMLEIVEETAHVPEEWGRILRERRLIEDSGLSKPAELLLEAYRKSVPIIYLTSDIAEFISGMPSGPAGYEVLLRYKELFGYAQNTIYALEAMRLLVLSPPWKGKVAFSLTEAGRLVKEALYELPFYKPLMLVNGEIRNLLGMKEKELTDVQKKELESYGLFSSEKGEFSPATKMLSEAYDRLTERRGVLYPLCMSSEEMRVLKGIKEAVDKGILATKEAVERLSGIGDVGFYLHLLESKNFVSRGVEEGREVAVLTEHGKLFLKVFGEKFRPLTTEATKAVILANANDVPRYDWVKVAEEAGLLGGGGLTYRGEVVLKLCREVKRSLLVTVYDASILAKVPGGKGISLEELVPLVLEDIEKRHAPTEEAVKIAVSEAESKGYIRVLHNDAVVLTDVGRELKLAIQMAKTSVIKGMKVSITPTVVRVLSVLSEKEAEVLKLWKEKEEIPDAIIGMVSRELGVPEDAAKEAITLLRGMGFLGKIGGGLVTRAGEQLLKAAASF